MFRKNSESQLKAYVLDEGSSQQNNKQQDCQFVQIFRHIAKKTNYGKKCENSFVRLNDAEQQNKNDFAVIIILYYFSFFISVILEKLISADFMFH